MALVKISTFHDWTDLFLAWQKDIGLDHPLVRQFKFETKFGDLQREYIEFGEFAGQPKWGKVMDIPNQQIRDTLLNLIVYQGDTEFASVEQQRRLFETAPSDYDLQALGRVMSEEMRHGWQMCHLLVEHFGYTGKVEAQKQLERRSWKKQRLLGSFNEDVDNWLDFYVYTDFVDRDGKFQLKMLSCSAFAPLARSMGPMLQEEAYHLKTGQTGLRRILRAGRIPSPVVQRYLNKWIPTAYDLFGTDHSSTAHRCYVWGLKGRFNEDSSAPDLDALNQAAREIYHQEVIGLVNQLNNLVPEGQPRLYAPDLKFHRAIGDFAGQPCSVTGERLEPEAYEKHLREFLPTPEDARLLEGLFKEAGWIAPPEAA
jgi:benzoyl-CoA 2,3-dioxygenase component B